MVKMKSICGIRSGSILDGFCGELNQRHRQHRDVNGKRSILDVAIFGGFHDEFFWNIYPSGVTVTGEKFSNMHPRGAAGENFSNTHPISAAGGKIWNIYTSAPQAEIW